jgi:hypothetical protein
MAKNFYIISNRLTKYIPFFEELKKKAFFTTHIISFKKLLSPSCKESIKSMNPSDVIFLIKNDFYTRVKEEFTEYLNSFFLPGFKNIIYVFTHPGILSHNDILSGKKHSFYLYEEKDFSGRMINLLLYTIKVYYEATLSERLLDYITTSFEGIVNEELLKKKRRK